MEGDDQVHIDRELINTLRQDSSIKRNLSHSHTGISAEIAKFIPVLESHIKQSSIEKASNWMLFKDLWLQNEAGYLNKTSINPRNYTRGSVIMSIDWGTSNIGTEIRYPHPGVVIFDQDEDWVIAAPITAAKVNLATMQPIAHPPFEVLAFKQNNQPSDKNEYWFRKHSVIQVDQIQRVSKYRIVNKKSYRLRDNLLNQVDNLILECFIPGKHSLLDKLKIALNDKNEELKTAEAQIEQLQSDIEALNKRLKDEK